MAHEAELFSQFYTIKVKFPNNYGTDYSGKFYTYKVPIGVKVEVDDCVIVRVEGNSPEIKLVKVFEVDDGKDINLEAAFTYKWIVGTVDIATYEKRMEEDKKLKSLVSELKNRKLKRSLIEELSAVATADELAILNQYK